MFLIRMLGYEIEGNCFPLRLNGVNEYEKFPVKIRVSLLGDRPYIFFQDTSIINNRLLRMFSEISPQAIYLDS